MKRIYMISSHPLFSQGVESLIRQGDGLEIVGRESDINKAIECIKLLRPDIVIVDHESPSCTQSPALLRILGEGLNAKVIGLNLLTNTICIYRGEHRQALNVQDLIYAIEHDLTGSEFVNVAERCTQERSDEQGSEGRTEKSIEKIDLPSKKMSGTQSA